MFHLGGWSEASFDTWRKAPRNTFLNSNGAFPHYVLFTMPQISAEGFVYARLPHICVTFVDSPPIAGVLAPRSDRYKQENAETAHRNINRAQNAAFFPGTVVPLSLPPVHPAPVQNTSHPAKSPLSRPIRPFRLWFPLLSTFPLLKWRPTST